MPGTRLCPGLPASPPQFLLPRLAEAQGEVEWAKESLAWCAAQSPPAFFPQVLCLFYAPAPDSFVIYCNFYSQESLLFHLAHWPPGFFDSFWPIQY